MGSNPTPSASFVIKSINYGRFYRTSPLLSPIPAAVGDESEANALAPRIIAFIEGRTFERPKPKRRQAIRTTEPLASKHPLPSPQEAA